MKKAIRRVFTFLGLVSLALLASGVRGTPLSRFSEPGSVSRTEWLSLEDIKKQLQLEGRTILQAIPYSDFLLVESRSSVPRTASFFDLYHLRTGTITPLPTDLFYVRLQNIVDENEIIIFSDGMNSESLQVLFPFYFEFRRNNFREPFCATRKPVYFPVSQGAHFGNKRSAALLSIRTTLEGIEALFGPKKGKEAEFAAAYYSIPVTQTQHIAGKNQLVIIFSGTEISEKVQIGNKIPDSGSEYFSSYEIRQSEGNCQIVLNLTDAARFYSAEIKNLQSYTAWPYVVFSFALEIQENH